MALALKVTLSRPGFSLDVDTELPTRGITALFGRSGCGKTTLLRCIAGLERFAGARVYFDGEAWQDVASEDTTREQAAHDNGARPDASRHQRRRGRFVPTHRRSIGYVFQEPSLFPHHDVRGNLQYGLRRVPAGQQRIGFDQAVTLLGLERLLAHRPEQLSGGQRQRVAIARALLASPRLLLMDEPLSSLDDTSKAEILPHLERLHDVLSVPMIYVSHALGEVMRLADHLVLLEDGRIRAAGPLQQLLTRIDLPLGRERGGGSVLAGTIAAHDTDYHLSYVAVSGGRLALSLQPLSPGQSVRVRIDAADVSLALEPPQRSSITNVLPARVLELDADVDPAQTLVRLQLGSDELLARITRRSATLLALAPGREVYAQIKSVALMQP